MRTRDKGMLAKTCHDVSAVLELPTHIQRFRYASWKLLYVTPTTASLFVMYLYKSLNLYMNTVRSYQYIPTYLMNFNE